jgi:RNA polymerase sigma-70 factor (ECF subfamily)
MSRPAGRSDRPADAEAAGPGARPERGSVDDKAFKAQLLQVIPSLRAFARSLCGLPDLADDLAQEALAKAWAARAAYAPDTHFKAWIFMILRNHYFSYCRKQRRVAAWDPDVAERELVTPGEQTGHVELAELSRAMHALPAEQREALILVGAGGFSYEEAAKVAGCAVGTIKSRVGRARAALKLALASVATAGQPLGSGTSASDELMNELTRLDPRRA